MDFNTAVDKKSCILQLSPFLYKIVIVVEIEFYHNNLFGTRPHSVEMSLRMTAPLAFYVGQQLSIQSPKSW